MTLSKWLFSLLYTAIITVIIIVVVMFVFCIGVVKTYAHSRAKQTFHIIIATMLLKLLFNMLIVAVVAVIVSVGIWHVCQKWLKTFEISHKTFYTHTHTHTSLNVLLTHACSAISYFLHTHTFVCVGKCINVY